jgi:putative transposase
VVGLLFAIMPVDDPLIVGLRFVFLLAVRLPAWLRLSRRSASWKEAEILVLRHQIAVLQRQSATRPRLSWADRALFAVLLSVIPRAGHGRLRLIVTPGTILGWHRDLVRRRWAAKSVRKKPGRPSTHPNVTRLVLRMAKDNEHWGYRRIAGELAGLGVAVAPSTVWEILKKHGIDTAPRRSGPGWADFLRSQAEAILALDLFTVDLLDGSKAYVLAAIEHAARRVRILGATTHPGGDWIVQQARNLLMDLEDAGAKVNVVLHDRDGIFHEGFDAVFTAAGMRIVRSGVRMPRMNSIIERWIGGCRRELLDRTLIWNLPHLRRVLAAYELHHNEHRPHRSLHSAAPLKPLPPTVIDLDAFRASRHDRITGVIHEYQQAA